MCSYVTVEHDFTLSHARYIFSDLFKSLEGYIPGLHEQMKYFSLFWQQRNTSWWRLWPVGLESFVYCLFRSQLAVAIATETHTMICGIVRFEDQLQSMLKESIIAWLLSITVADSCVEWVQNPKYRCLRTQRCYVSCTIHLTITD